MAHPTSYLDGCVLSLKCFSVLNTLVFKWACQDKAVASWTAGEGLLRNQRREPGVHTHTHTLIYTHTHTHIHTR